MSEICQRPRDVAHLLTQKLPLRPKGPGLSSEPSAAATTMHSSSCSPSTSASGEVTPRPGAGAVAKEEPEVAGALPVRETHSCRSDRV